MDSIDDDFGDLYADVEVQATSAINGVSGAPKLCSGDDKTGVVETINGSDLNRIDSVSDKESEEIGSDSEDDFDIVLNDDNGGGLEFPVNRSAAVGNGEEENKEGKEVDEVKDFGGFIDEGMEQSLNGGERRNGGKGCYNSQYKYMRPQPSTLASTSRNSRCEGPGSLSTPLVKCEQEDNRCYHGIKPKLLGGQSVHQFSLPRSRTIVDVNIDAFSDKPWKHPEANITDFFNFDFDEDSWKHYCNYLDRYRHGDINPTRAETSNLTTHNGFYGIITKHERVSQRAVDKTQNRHGRMFLESESPTNEQEHSKLQKGRAIQVAGSNSERQSSMDTRHPIDRDSDVVIQEPKEPGSVKKQVDCINSSEQRDYENGNFGTDDDMDGLSFGGSSEYDLYREPLDDDGPGEGLSTPNSKRYSAKKQPPEEAAFLDSEGTTKTVKTTNKSKKEVSRSTCSTAPTILEADFPHDECNQYSRSPSYSNSDSEECRDGAHIDVEKSYNYVKRHVPISLTGLQKSVTPDYYHTKGTRGQFGKVKYRDVKYSARFGYPVQEDTVNQNCSLYAISGSKSYINDYEATSNSVTVRDYDHHLALDHGIQEEKLYDYSAYHEDDFLYDKETNLSYNSYDERFPDFQIEDAGTKYPHSRGNQRSKVASNRFHLRSPDERAYVHHDDMLKRDADCYEKGTMSSMHPLTCQESKKLNLNYSENERDTRWKRKGHELQFRGRIRHDKELSFKRKYFHDSSHQKYKKSDPYDVRGRNNLIYEYKEHLPYARGGAKSPVRGRRKCMDDEDDFWRSRYYRSFSSRPYRETHTAKTRWQSTMPPESHMSEINGRQERYEKHIWTERSKGIDIEGGYAEAFNTQESVNDYDDQVYTSIRRHNPQSDLLYCSEDERFSRHQSKYLNAETTWFSCKRTSWNKRFDAEDRTGHVRNLSYDMQVDQLDYKWMSDGDSSKQQYRSSDMYNSGNHEQTLLACQDSVDVHLVDWEGKSRGRSCAAGSSIFKGRYDNMGLDSGKEKQTMFTGYSKANTKMERQLKNPDVNISYKDETCLNGFSDTLQKALDIEEGQILTDDIMEDAMKNNICMSGNLSQNSGVKGLHTENATENHVTNKECSTPRILEVIAKMEKRRERFKEPITPKDKILEPLTASAADGSGTIKQQRPARKRRWGGH